VTPVEPVAAPGLVPGARRGGLLLTLGLALMAGLVGVALLAPLLAPYDPLATTARVGDPLPPDAHHWLGTDALGRDVLSRLIFGARLSLAVGGAAMLVTLLIGVSIGVVAGYSGGLLDALLMRLTDLVLALPALLIAIALAAVLEPSTRNLLLVIALVSWTTVARVVRGEVNALRHRDYVTAARALGIGPLRQALVHLLPGVATTVVTLAALSTSSTLLLEAGLSYLGLGVPPPAPSFGRMVSEGGTYYRTAPWLIVFPGSAIMLAVFACNLIAQGLLARAGGGKRSA
jgi:peptide/nickel transport system permease protein